MTEPLIAEGWKDIAATLEVHPNTAQRWARQNVDPLPVRTNHRGVYAWVSALRSWIDRQDKSLQAEEELRALRAEVKDLRVRVGASAPAQPVKRPREKRSMVQ